MPSGRAEFTFVQCLGKGGFGEVYLAMVHRAGGLEKKVAVKVLREGLHNEQEAVQRLLDEGRMLATLNHPCILRPDDLHRIRGRIALVTEYIPGIDLSRCCKKGRLLPPRVVVSALGEVADALHCALNTPSPLTNRPLKLIHRDIKPENIRISVHGQVKLLDFGIARTSEIIRRARTMAGDVPFTPGYAAPESFIRGEQGPASDIYALGATMYRLTMGERLYQDMALGDQVAVSVVEDRYGAFLAERLSVVQTPPPVLKLLGSMLAWDSRDRPTASEVHEACYTITERLDGPDVTRWARSLEFPPPRNVKGASLTGLSLTEDPLTDSMIEEDRLGTGAEHTYVDGQPPLGPPLRGPKATPTAVPLRDTAPGLPGRVVASAPRATPHPPARTITPSSPATPTPTPHTPTPGQRTPTPGQHTPTPTPTPSLHGSTPTPGQHSSTPPGAAPPPVPPSLLRSAPPAPPRGTVPGTPMPARSAPPPPGPAPANPNVDFQSINPAGDRLVSPAVRTPPPAPTSQGASPEFKPISDLPGTLRTLAPPIDSSASTVPTTPRRATPPSDRIGPNSQASSGSGAKIALFVGLGFAILLLVGGVAAIVFVLLSLL